MNYTKISPLGPRTGTGTFDCFFDTQKYKAIDEAIAAGDYVQIDFVKDDNGTKFFEAFHMKNPTQKVRKQLEIQHFPFGIDVRDDNNACQMAEVLFGENK